MRQVFINRQSRKMKKPARDPHRDLIAGSLSMVHEVCCLLLYQGKVERRGGVKNREYRLVN